MKKIAIVLNCMILSVLVSAQNHIGVSQHPGNIKSPGEGINSGNRSIPPGTLLYSQPFLCPPYNGLNSYTLYENCETADDFILTTNGSIDVVRWWFFLADSPESTSWIIRIYNDYNCLPDALVNTWNIAPGAVHYEYVCYQYDYPIYDLWVGLSPSFAPVPGQHYWISIQAVGYDDYWCAYGTPGQYFNCMGAFRCPEFGIPNWVSVTTIWPWSSDFTYELYSYSSAIPVSNWAIGLGIFLILFATALTYRRMV